MSTTSHTKAKEVEGRTKNKANSSESSPLTNFFVSISNLTVFSWRFVKEALKPPYEFREFMKQSYQVGCKSVVLISITGFIMGLVLTIQARPTMLEFGAESWIPGMVAVSIIREIGPVITALIFAGKVGSGIGAELASMKVTEQIDAMEVTGMNPFKYLVVTRVMATSLMLPLLVIYADVIALSGSFAGVNLQGDVSFQLFFLQVIESLDFIDLYPSLIKSVFFGFAIGIIGCYAGYNSSKGTEGVGKSANAAVVYASLLVFIIDMLAVQITNLYM